MADNGLTPTETVGLIAAVHAVARVIEGGFKAMIGFFKKQKADADQQAKDAKHDATVAAIYTRINTLNDRQSAHEKDDAAIHAEFVALKDDVKEMKADLKTLLRRSTDQVKR